MFRTKMNVGATGFPTQWPLIVLISLLFASMAWFSPNPAEACSGAHVWIEPEPETPPWVYWTANRGDSKIYTIRNRPDPCYPHTVKLTAGMLPSSMLDSEILETSSRHTKIRVTIPPGAFYGPIRHQLKWSVTYDWFGTTGVAGTGTFYLNVTAADGPRLDLAVTDMSVTSPTDQWENLVITAEGRNIGKEVPLNQREHLQLEINGQVITEVRCNPRVWNESRCVLPPYREHVAAGRYQVKVCADPDQNSRDGFLDNNCRHETIDVPEVQPDLVTSLRAMETPSVGEPWTVSVEVRNDGNANTSAYTFRLETPEGVQEVQRPPLGWGYVHTFDMQWTPTRNGQITVVGTADPRGVVPDHDRDSNEDFLTATVEGTEIPPELPNLTLLDGSWKVTPPAPQVGDAVSVEVEIVNAGGAPTNTASRFTFTGEGTSSTVCPELLPGETCSGTHTFVAKSVGALRISLEVDADGQIVEGDGGELDNSFELDVDIDPAPVPDLAQLYMTPSGIVSNDPQPRMGNQDFTITVQNSGAATQSPVYLQIFEDEVLRGEAYTGDAIAAGGSGLATYTWNDLTEGQHQLRVVIDPFNAVPEMTEDDNIRSLNFVVEGHDNPLRCQGLWTLTHVVENESFTSSGSVSGTCDVHWGANVPTSCWRTSGVDGMTAIWTPDPVTGCPISVIVSTGDEYRISRDPM